MIKRISHLNIFVLDQDRAKRFYTEQLGFNVDADLMSGPMRVVQLTPPGSAGTARAARAVWRRGCPRRRPRTSCAPTSGPGSSRNRGRSF